MLKICRHRLSVVIRSFSSSSKQSKTNAIVNAESQASYYTAKDIEFCPGRAKEVMQNHVEESSNGTYTHNDKIFQEDDDQMLAYKAYSSVNLHSVMQSNVPEPFESRGHAPTYLNMPGSSSSRDYKYLSDKMQTVHQSKLQD